MPKIIVSDTSPLFYLHRVGCLELLRRLYGNIIVPQAVIAELEEGREQGEDVPDIDKYQWIKVQHITVPLHIKLIPDLGKGESEVLSMGLCEEQHLIIIDDKLAREIARLQNLRFTGTAGILLKSKKKKYLTEIKPVLCQLEQAGFFLRKDLIVNILQLADEM